MTWQELLNAILCKIMQAIGLDCNNMGSTPSDWVNTVTDAMDPVPTVSDPTLQEKLHNTLDQLESHLAEPGNTLSTSETAALTTMIGEARAAVPDPR